MGESLNRATEVAGSKCTFASLPARLLFAKHKKSKKKLILHKIWSTRSLIATFSAIPRSDSRRSQADRTPGMLRKDDVLSGLTGRQLTDLSVLSCLQVNLLRGKRMADDLFHNFIKFPSSISEQSMLSSTLLPSQESACSMCFLLVISITTCTPREKTFQSNNRLLDGKMRPLGRPSGSSKSWAKWELRARQRPTLQIHKGCNSDFQPTRAMHAAWQFYLEKHREEMTKWQSMWWQFYQSLSKDHTNLRRAKGTARP